MKRKLFTIAIGGFLAAATLSAQNTNSGYFLDGYTYRYAMNPAYGNDNSFVSMPALGNVNLAMRGNLHLSSVLYNVNGRTALFTNPNISAAEVMGNLSDKNRLGTDIKLNIMSAGFKAFGGYNTVSLNARAGVNAMVPKALFSLAKEGVTNTTYDITDLNASAMGWGEIAFNHSRDIKQVPGLRVGASVKFLIGVANLDANFNKAHLVLGENAWTATTNADIYANLGKFQYKLDTNNQGKEYVNGVDMDGDGSVSPNGFGMSFDLGATYRWSDFDFSLALLDLGWITFSNTKFASTNGDRTFNTDAYVFSADDDATNSFDNEWDRFKDNLDNLYQLTDNGITGSRSRALGATLNIGARYELPMYRKLHFGFLSSTRIAGRYSWSEGRFSANVAPVKAFSADINVAFSTYGTSFGWLLNAHPKGFNIFLGMDHTLGKVTKQFVPLSSNASLNFGINFPF
ncbi:MAG: hypothetical protein K2L93_02350 [Muribaculaceae bacterium]|nr:hypothetical protein [Muribaculaceae bacterium]MDE6321115.1 hypothetical protein [Muribaculaceae bacterium]